MNKRHFIFACLFLFSFISLARAEKRAFLVCVGEYAEGTGWNKISAINDRELIKDNLSPSFIIESISNQDATRSGMMSFLNSIANIVSQHDTVLLLFSCHGQQMLAVNDKNEPDGLDEAIIPYDAYQEYSESYHGENHLRDDDIAIILRDIRNALGEDGLLLVLFDACHSDSMYKGGKSKRVIRGSSDIFGPAIDSTIADSLKRIKYAQDTVSIGHLPGASEAIYISACRASQRNKEVIIDGVGYGSLSYAFMTSYMKYDGLKDISATLSYLQDWMKKNAQQPAIHSSFKLDLSSTTASDSDLGNNSGIPNGALVIICVLAFILILCICLVFMKKRTH